jgi:hypothetical protein
MDRNMEDSSGDSPELLGAVENRLTDEGWRIDRTEVSPGVYQIAALDPETEQRRVLAVLPNPEATVRAEHCTWLAAQADETAADAAELVTAGTVPDDVADIAREHDVSILDPATFAESADQPSAATNDPGAASQSDGQQAGGAQAGAGQSSAGQPPGQPARGQGQSDPRQRSEPPQQGTAPPRNSRQEPAQPQNQQPPKGTALQNQQTPPQNAQQGVAQPRDQKQHAAPQQSQHQHTAPPQNAQQGGISNWSSSRLLAIGGGILAGVSLFLPWVVSIEGSQSWNGMATEFSTFVMVPVLLAVLFPAASWGRGWGRLSALVTLVIGGVMAAGGFVIRTGLSETLTTGTIELDGQVIPMAVVEGGVGLDVFMLAGVLILIASLGGLVGSFQS